jgi:hypothetical protein
MVQIIARAMMRRLHECVAADIHPVPPQTYTWKDWVLNESRRRYAFAISSFPSSKVLSLIVVCRTLCIFRLLSLLFDLSPAGVCSPAPGFLLMPLPTSKLLWEAHDAEAWRKEIATETKSNAIFGLLTNGQLMRLERYSTSEARDSMVCMDHTEEEKLNLYYSADHADEIWRSGENWADWAAGMDAFGFLIMVAASLVDVVEY